MDSLTEYERNRQQIEEYFREPFIVDGEKIDFPAVICGIINSEKMEQEDVLLAYVEYLVSLVKHTDETVVIQSDDRILEGFRYEKEVEHFLKNAVEDFQNAGIGLCLDDFGSGYANLNAVLKLPFDVVKMDRSLLTGITCDEQAAIFYRSIVMVMQNMGYMIVAEGAETEEEVNLLRSWGVDMVQGYYFSRPLPEKELLKLF